MQTRIVTVIMAWGLIAFGCEDEHDPSTATLAARGGGRATASGDAGTVVPPGLSCGGLVGRSTCDPVTAWPCDTSQQNCVYSASASAYRCEAIPNQQPLCAPCDEVLTFCGPGLLCSSSLGCERFCCIDSDCPIGHCEPNAFGDDDVYAVGFCRDETLAVCAADAGSSQALP